VADRYVVKLRKRLLMSRSTAEGETTSRHSRVVDGAVIAVIAMGVAVNAAVLIDHGSSRAEPGTGSGSSVAEATSLPSTPAAPTTAAASVAGVAEERPAWAKELADQVSVLAALIAEQGDTSSTTAPQRTARPRAPRTTATTTTTTVPVSLGPATAIERTDPTTPSSTTGTAVDGTTPQPTTADPTTVVPTTTSSPVPTYLAAG